MLYCFSNDDNDIVAANTPEEACAYYRFFDNPERRMTFDSSAQIQFQNGLPLDGSAEPQDGFTWTSAATCGL